MSLFRGDDKIPMDNTNGYSEYGMPLAGFSQEIINTQSLPWPYLQKSWSIF
jgi:hypothetical protein